ncbi:MAG: M3 family metallopeptidase [Pseudomonadales bacterium]|nr:M3 family metallopeptidase [Pseudomonadales bacterium]MDG1444499.1 M3 family metallopeptidase [Pseudomonadales bacterium]
MINPLLQTWQTPHKFPPFQQIKPEHYVPAFEEGFKEQQSEVTAIVENPAQANFENCIEALERSGALLKKVAPVLGILTNAHTNDELKQIQSTLSPLVAAHNSAIYANQALFTKVKSIMDNPPHNLSKEQQQLLGQFYKRMLRSGASLNSTEANLVSELDKKLASLQTQFGHNVLSDTNSFELVIEDIADLDGLPESVVSAAKDEATNRGYSEKYVFSISRSSITPFLSFSTQRELREKMWNAYTHCANNDNDANNKNVAVEIATLRAQRAALLGYKTHAEFTLDEQMAATSDNVRSLLDQLWAPTQVQVHKEIESLQLSIQNEGSNFKLKPWDWWYYTEKVRQEKYDLDLEEIKPYFELARVRQGAFDVATQLYGITFTKIDNFPNYHPDVDTFEVNEADGSLIGLFCTDYFLRSSKKAGAWMNALRVQQTFDGEQYPIILNTCNFPKASPCLLGPDEVRTLFHEFGHGLHGLLSRVSYGSLSGTAVKRDFVELPSQIMEHWAIEPTVLKQYARHHKTNKAIPTELINKILATQTFNQGFATTEYLAASYLDLKWHDQTVDDQISASEIESKTTKDINLVPEIAPRYRSSYFQHIFSGGYSAGYYAYIWAEVLETDAYEEFKKNGIFDKKTAQSFRSNILEKGGSEKPMTLYKNFVGREPNIEPLMKSRGLLAE